MYWYVLIMYQVFEESIVMQLGGLSVVDTQERKVAANLERNNLKRGAETRWRRKADQD